MGVIKYSVAWRDEFQARFRSLRCDRVDDVEAFFEWWRKGITLAIMGRFDSFPEDDESLSGYLSTFKVRCVKRELTQWAKAGAPVALEPYITHFILDVFDDFFEKISGRSDLPNRTTNAELLTRFKQRIVEAN